MFKYLLFLLLWFPAYTSRAANFRPPNGPGAYGVGFRVVQQYDRAHVYKQKIDLTSGTLAMGERTRPLQTLIWYPAKQASGKPLHYGDYVRLAATETVFARTAAEIDQLVAATLTENYAD